MRKTLIEKDGTEVKAPVAPIIFKRMEPNLFEKMRDGITEIARRVRPSGSNGRMPLFVTSIQSFFAQQNVTEREYWQEVAMRMPSKAS